MDRLAADRMFVSVIRLGGFSAAAAHLGTSAGQASKLVSRLETHLGVRLLNRTTRALTLTAEGESYLASIAPLLDEIADIDAGLRDAGQTATGQLRLTAPLTFGTTQLVPALADFAKAHPGIGLHVQFTDDVMGLAQHGFDAAIRVGNPPDSTLIARKLGVMRIQIVAAPAYLAARGVPRQPADLAGHDIITDLNFSRPDDWAFTGGRVIPLPGRLRFTNAEACVTAAIAGLGITRVPDFASARAVRAGDLVEILRDCHDDQAAIHAITPAGRHMPSRLRLLIEFLRDRWGPGHDWSD